MMDGKSHFYELGYRFLEEYWGKGYGSEAAQAMSQFAFTILDVPTLVGSAHVKHGASNRLLEKAGLYKTHEFEEDGELWTWYEVSKEKWLNDHGRA
jgi:RimJ/RimL family protein N-acetyltransferase